MNNTFYRLRQDFHKLKCHFFGGQVLPVNVQCVDNKLSPAISLILVTKPEFIPVRQAAPSVQNQT